MQNTLTTAFGNKVIEEIQVEDMVWAENPETGEKELKKVVRTFINESDELVHIFVNKEEIITTPEHPFYVPEKGWIGAIKLRAGDVLVLQNGKYVIVEQVQHEILEEPVTVYNFEVEDFHTYYVGESSILVHNACDVPPPTHIQNLGNDPTKCNVPGFEWRGKGVAGSSTGNYYNSATREWLHPDLNHAPPIGPHWDYGMKNGNNTYRIFLDGNISLK